jgi:hypothetical protein
MMRRLGKPFVSEPFRFSVCGSIVSTTISPLIEMFSVRMLIDS